MKISSSKWLIFVLVAIAQFMVVLDNSITNVALPTIRQDLGFTASSLQWVVTAYALTFGGFLLLGGRAADLFGRKKTLLIGMIAFTVFSFLIGISHGPGELIAFRVLQGAAAAFMSPSALSIVLVTFGNGDDRNKALSFWAMVATGGAALGLLLGGVLTEYLGWRWNFFVNVPIGIVMSLLIIRYVPAHGREERDNSLDIPGAILATSSLMILVLAISQAPQWGWLDISTIGTFLLGLGLLAGFLWNETKAKHPLMPLSIFKIRNLRGANLIMAPMIATMFGTFFLTTLYLQGVLHMSPITTGFSFLPFPITLALTSSQMPRLVRRYGFKRFMVAGPLVSCLGLLWLTQLSSTSSYLTGILPAFILLPLGIGMTMTPTIVAATSGVPGHQSGLASGLINTSQQMGGALGLSIISGIAASVASSSIALGPVDAAIHGYSIAFTVGIGFMLLAAFTALTVIRTPKSVHSDNPATPVIVEI